MKYAKWKAVEIDRCLKNGIMPTPGPPGGDEGGAVGYDYTQPYPSDTYSADPPQSDDRPVPKPRHNLPNVTPGPSTAGGYDSSPPKDYNPSNIGFRYDEGGTAHTSGSSQPSVSTEPPETASDVGGVKIGPDETARVQKLCKFASSTLDYDDVQGAIEYLTKALNLLKTGKED